MFKINTKYLKFLTLFLSFFASTQFAIARYRITIFIPLLFFIMFIYIYKNPVSYINSFVKDFTYQKSPFYYLGLYLIVTIITTAFSTLLIGIHFKHFILYSIACILQIILPIWLSKELVYRKFSTNTLLKIFIGAFYIILLLGIVDFFAYLLNITFIQDILKCFFTRWILVHENFVKVTVGAIPRMQSIYDEPSQFGWIIYLCSPLILSIYLNKIKIFKRKLVDKLIRLTILPIMYFDLIFTFSPMMIIYSGFAMVTVVLYKSYENFKTNKKKFIKQMCVIGLLLAVIFCFFCFENEGIKSVLSRMQAVLNNIQHIDDLIMAEQSLGTRIGTMINNLAIFVKHPFIGVGLGQLTPHMQHQLAHSPVVLTPELMMQFIKGTAGYSGVMYKILSENGIIGFILFSLVFVRILLNIKLCHKKIANKKEYYCLLGLAFTTIATYCLFFYDIPFNNSFVWVLIGITIAVTQRINER